MAGSKKKMISNDLRQLTALCESIPSLSNFEQQRVAYQSIEAFVSNPANFGSTLTMASSSQTCLFVISEVLTKYIIKFETESISLPFRSIDPVMEDSPTIYSLVIESMHGFILNPLLPKFIANSCINLVAICLKYNLTMMNQIENLRNFLEGYFPEFHLDINFMNNLSSQVYTLSPTSGLIPNNFQRLVSILISLMEHITLSIYFGNYYEYRRYVYTFKNNYLAGVLQICVWYLKILIQQTTQPPEQNPMLKSHMSILLRLTQMVVSYPFTLSLQEFEFDEELRENSVGEIYFPNYFRNVTTDTHFMQGLYRLYTWYNAVVEFDSVSQDVLNLLRIMGKVCSANSYYFDTESQRRQFRLMASDMLTNIIQIYRSYDDIYTAAVLDLCYRVLNSYTIKDYENCISNFLLNTVVLCQKVVDNCPIKLENRQHNPTCKALDILNMVHEEMKAEPAKPLLQFNPTEIKIGIQQILQSYINRLCNQEARIILEFKFKSYDREVDTFQELFRSAVALFHLDSSMNFRKANQMDVQSLSKPSQILWIHFMGTLLQETSDEDLDQEKVRGFLRVLDFVQYNLGICSLRYINIFINKILTKIDIRGQINSNFWLLVSKISQKDLSFFVQLIIKKCTNNIAQTQDSLGYSLDILSGLYSKLKRNKIENINAYSIIFRDLLQNLQKGVFSNPKFNKLRTKLYQIVSSLWVQHNQVQMIYQVYSHIRQKLQQDVNLQNFLKYMYDITGLISPVQSASSYKILIQLFLKDMQLLNIPFLQQKNVKLFLSQPEIVKAFIRLCLALINDSSRRLTYYTQSSLGLELQTLLHGAIQQCASRKVSKKMFLLLRSFLKLCPIRPAIPIPKYQKSDLLGLQQEFNDLVCCYFDNIQRVSDLSTLYPYIEDKIELLILWYEEAVNRELPLTHLDFKTCVQARLWKTSKEKESVAKLAYMVGSYDQKLRIIPELFFGNIDQGIFVRRFQQYYK